VAAGEQVVRTVGAAVDAFLARGDLAASSRRSYAQTLNRLAADVGADRALVMLNADVLGGAVQDAWVAARRRPGIVTSRPPLRGRAPYRSPRKARPRPGPEKDLLCRVVA
jgi:hypothetical protein